MKQHIKTAWTFLAVIALAVIAAGCASTLPNEENMTVSAGFKPITPTKPDQQAILAKLPSYKVTRVVYAGKTYYVLPDRANNKAYVGGPKQYAAYKQLRLAKQMSNDNLEAGQLGQGDSQNMGDWNGWGVWDPTDWY
ncbi:MAG TPA: hypothetical protein VIT91_16890 [Chthoniobacterales bacterium]